MVRTALEATPSKPQTPNIPEPDLVAIDEGFSSPETEEAELFSKMERLNIKLKSSLERCFLSEEFNNEQGVPQFLIEQIKELFTELFKIARKLSLSIDFFSVEYYFAPLISDEARHLSPKIQEQFYDLMDFTASEKSTYVTFVTLQNLSLERANLAQKNKESLLQNEQPSDKKKDMRRLGKFRQHEMREILPALQNYVSNCREMRDIIYKHKPSRLPPAVRDTVNGAVFDGPMSNYKEWSEARLESGWIAHMMALYMQIFRNSDEAGTISAFYSSLGPSGKLALEKDLKELVNDDFLFDFMFAMPMIPFIIDPRERPGNYVVSNSHNGDFESFIVYDENGRLVFGGNYDVFSELEGTNFYSYDSNGNMVMNGHYYDSGQPNFEFLIYNNDNQLEETFFWKNYLLHKGGGSFFYQHAVLDKEKNRLVVPDDNEFATDGGPGIQFTKEQLVFLYHFYGIHITDEEIVEKYDKVRNSPPD